MLLTASALVALAYLAGALENPSAQPDDWSTRIAEAPSAPATVAGSDEIPGCVIQLRSVDPDQIDGYAESISIGPRGPDFPDTSGTVHDSPRMVQDMTRGLRVTLSTRERSAWLKIDDMKTGGHADTRIVLASYKFDTNDFMALKAEPPSSSTGHYEQSALEPITWISPTAFSWSLTPYETIVFEQVSGANFRVRRLSHAR